MCSGNYALHVQMKFPKHLLVQTRDINQELECLRYMYHYIFCIWGHISNEILRGGNMGMVKNILIMFYQQIIRHKVMAINEIRNRHREFVYN